MSKPNVVIEPLPVQYYECHKVGVSSDTVSPGKNPFRLPPLQSIQMRLFNTCISWLVCPFVIMHNTIKSKGRQFTNILLKLPLVVPE